MLGLLSNKRYLPFFVSFFAGSFAEGLAAVVVPFVVLAATGSAVAVGLCLAAQTAGVLLVVLPAAAISDRFPRHKVISLAYWIAGFSLLGAFSSLSLGLNVWSVGAFLFLFGGATAVYGPASDAMTPTLVDRADLHRANAMDGLGQRVGQGVLGPLVGGLLITLGYGVWAFACSAFLCVVAAFLILRTRPSRAEVIDASEPHPQSWRAVFRYLQKSPLFVTLLIWVSVSVMLTVGAKPVGATAWTNSIVGGGALLYGSALAIGSVISAFVIVVIGSIHLPRRYIELMVGAWSFGAGVLWLAISFPSPWAFLVTYAFSSALMATGNIYWSTYVQLTIPDSLRARVISIDWVASLALTPVGAAMSGFIVSTWGAGTMLAIIATVPLASGALIVGLILVTGQSLKQDSVRPSVEPAATILDSDDATSALE